MQRWKNRMVAAAGFIFLMLAGSLLHVPQWVAHAATVFSSPTSNIIEAYRIPYQANLRSVPCAAGCRISFPVVPAGYRLYLRNVSYVGFAGSLAPALRIHLDSHLNGETYLAPVAGDVNPQGTNQEVAFYFPAGTAPVLDLHFPLPWPGANVSATLSGHLENCSTFPGGVCPGIIN